MTKGVSGSVIPDVFNRESRIFPTQRHMNEGTKEKDTGFPLKTCGNDRRRGSGMTKGVSGSVIPDVFNRESRGFPMQGHTKEGTKEKDTGFPLETCGNDRRRKRE